MEYHRARVFVDLTSQFIDRPGVGVGVGSGDIDAMVLVICLPGRIQFREMSSEVLNCAVDIGGLTSGTGATFHWTLTIL